jgi:hypothetical protein
MKIRTSHEKRWKRAIRSLAAAVCAALLVPGEASFAATQEQQPQAGNSQQAAAKLPPEQLDSLVAPIALYPDPLLSQTLMASTYPLEIVQLQQWLGQHKDLKDKALADAAAKQPWDPSVQAMAATPDLVKRLADDIKWTTDLGNAFLAQQNDVMDAVQRMRGKAKDKGNLKSTEQQKVETKVVENKQVIVIEQANPQVVYVPSYNPTVVYGPPVYAYPPIYYPPPPPPGYYAAGMAISFGVGVAMGAFWGGGSCCGCGWGGNNNVYINNNNNFVRNSNANINRNANVNRSVNARGGNSTWQHNPQHRGGAPYADRNTANRYGGTARGDSLQARQNQARQTQARQQGSFNNRAGGAGNRGTSAGAAGNRSASAGTMDRTAGGNRASAGTADRSANRGASDRVGNQSVSRSGSSGAFGGGSGASARASSARGASSFGGGGSRGGGRRR